MKNFYGLAALLVVLFGGPLFAEESGTLVSSSTGTIMYLVKEGDTLAHIAYKYYGSGKEYPRIAEANKVKNPHMIYAGTMIAIPPRFIEIPKPVEPEELPAVETVPVASTAKFVWRQETNAAFKAPEKLRFAVAWKFIVVGYAKMEAKEIQDIGGRSAYHIYTEARSAKFFDNFYKVRNTNESWMDVESLCSLKYASVSDEKDQKKTETIEYDQVNHKFKILEKDVTGDIPNWVQDVLSSLYYIRTKNLEVGQEYSIDAHSGDMSWPLVIKVIRREKKEVPAGEFDCLVLEPAIREGAGIFQAKGRLWVWVTADEKKMPVLMSSKIAIGSIEARLLSVE